MGRKISIVGSGHVSLPFYWDSAPEIWAVKKVTFALIQKGSKVDRSYWLDNINDEMKKWNDGTVEFLTEGWMYPNTTVHLVQAPEIYDDKEKKIEFKHIRLFDLEAVGKKMNSDFINSSFAMALADVCLEKDLDEVHIHGCDFMPDSVLGHPMPEQKSIIRQAQAVGYWLGRLEGMGVSVRVNHMSQCLEQHFVTEKGFRVRGFPSLEMDKYPTTNLKNWQRAKDAGRFREMPDDPIKLIALQVQLAQFQIGAKDLNLNMGAVTEDNGCVMDGVTGLADPDVNNR